MTQKGRKRRALVTGAGGFIGHHLTKYLKARGYSVRGVDLKEPLYERSPADEFLQLDLRNFENCAHSVHGIDDIYQLAADMGGIGYITSNHAALTRNNVLINANMLEAARLAEAKRYLYASSACVYPSFLQENERLKALKELDAIPADPEKGYGWEKLFSEQLAIYFHQEFGLDIRIVRLHNIYGPLGTFDGGREKAPAAICRKVAMSPNGSEIEIWGDGEQTRSFCYIDDCVDGLSRIMESGYTKPLNLGTEELININQLVDIVCRIAGKTLLRKYLPHGAQGVRGRNSDNTLLREVVGWEPRTKLWDGILRLYPWIWEQVHQRGRAEPPVPETPKTDSITVV